MSRLLDSPHVFLSYNSKDKSFVETITKKFKAKGVNPWTDTEDIYKEKEEGSPSFPDALAEAIRKAEAIVIFCGKHGLGLWQDEEAKLAFNLNINSEKLYTENKEKIPFFKKDTNKKKIRIVLVGLPNVNLRKVSLEYGLLATRSFIIFKSVRDENAMTNLLSALQKELPSEKNMDYGKLRDLLKDKKWQEADEETARCMREAMEKDHLTDKDLQNFPSTDLHTIDLLWLQHSEKRFGFSIQKDIWISTGKDRAQFADCVNWRFGGKTNGWYDYNQLFSSGLIQNRGFLPHLCFHCSQEDNVDYFGCIRYCICFLPMSVMFVVGLVWESFKLLDILVSLGGNSRVMDLDERGHRRGSIGLLDAGVDLMWRLLGFEKDKYKYEPDGRGPRGEQNGLLGSLAEVFLLLGGDKGAIDKARGSKGENIKIEPLLSRQDL